MIENIILLLIYICLLAVAVYLIIWVLGIVGVNLPPKVVQILWVIVALIALLLIVRVILGAGGLKLGQMPFPAPVLYLHV